MKKVEIALWYITDEYGKRRMSRWAMTAQEALARDPKAERVESTVQEINVPESREEELDVQVSRTTGGFLRGKRVLVCGGRDFNDKEAVFRALDKLHSTGRVVLVIHGAAPGADSLAAQWAQEHGIRCTACPADWKTHGKRAGPLRNSHMLTLKPDGVVAFPGGRGTMDMIKQAEAAGVKVWKPFG